MRIESQAFLAVLLLLAMAGTNYAEAKVSSVRNGVQYSPFTATGRNLHDQGNRLDEDNTSSNLSESDYDGSVPEDFDFGYTYKYEDLSEYEAWPISTTTLLEFSDGWYEGKISSFSMSSDKKNATYIVTWSDGTADSFSNELEWMDLMVANAEDYQPWEIGTPTYGYPNPAASDFSDGEEATNAYLSGEITAFEDGAYTVTWSNSDEVVYNDFDMVDQLVNNAAIHLDPSWTDNYDPWPKGTPVSWDFDDGWWDGTISDFSDGTYEVTWSDGSSKYYSNLEKIDQMVSFATGEGFIGNLADPETQPVVYPESDDNIYSEYYALETLVYTEFKDGWWAGYIDSYEGDYYVIRWSDDSVDKFLPGEDMDEMVLYGQYIPEDYGIWPEGTHVYKEFDGTYYSGTIEYSKGGFYTVLWDDGERTTYVSGSEIDEMVENAYKSNMNGFEKTALSILVLGCLGAVVFFVSRRNNKNQQMDSLTEQVKENDLDFNEENTTTGLQGIQGKSLD